MDSRIGVLHVDDDPCLTDMVAEFIQRHNDRFDVHTASSPDDGVAVLATHDIDCIVSDYEMPGQSGLDFLETVREDHPDLPFVLYTGKGSEEVASTAISKGVTDYLQKERGTAHYEVLANTIENAVSKVRAERHAAAMECRYQALFQQSEAAIAWVEYRDEIPVLRDVNPEFRALFCAPDEAVLGDNLDGVVAADDRSIEARTLSEKVRTGQSINGTLTRDTLDGPKHMQVQVISVPSPHEGGTTYALAIYSEADQSPSDGSSTAHTPDASSGSVDSR